MHDALVKAMPGNLMSPSLAESWSISADQKSYEFKLREGLKFHNGDHFTAEDMKFSFYCAKGKLAQRHRPPRGRARADADQPVPVVRAARGSPAQETMSSPWSFVRSFDSEALP